MAQDQVLHCASVRISMRKKMHTIVHEKRSWEGSGGSCMHRSLTCDEQLVNSWPERMQQGGLLPSGSGIVPKPLGVQHIEPTAGVQPCTGSYELSVAIETLTTHGPGILGTMTRSAPERMAACRAAELRSESVADQPQQEAFTMRPRQCGLSVARRAAVERGVPASSTSRTSIRRPALRTLVMAVLDTTAVTFARADIITWPRHAGARADLLLCLAHIIPGYD